MGLKKDVVWFCNKHQVSYNVLINGKDLAEKYGISAFPTLVLIDKEGKVLYSGGFNQSEIEKLIEKAL
jgi:thioredoxin-related protein